jgi:hypothetical protein
MKERRNTLGNYQIQPPVGFFLSSMISCLLFPNSTEHRMENAKIRKKTQLCSQVLVIEGLFNF